MYFTKITGENSRLENKREVLEEFINLLHKVVSKRVPRKFVTTARIFSVKCKCSSVSGELQIVSGGGGKYFWECENSCFNRDASQGIPTKLILMTSRLFFVKCR